MDQNENVDFPPKKTVEGVMKTMDTVTVASDWTPKTLTLFGGTRGLDTEKPGLTPWELPRHLVFTKFGLSTVATSDSQPALAENLNSPTRSLVLSPSLPSSMKPETPKAALQEASSNTLKVHRQCRCKQTRCLKLYCECFASGVYCDGCGCVDCHNNIENEATRKAAAEIILERKPNAFSPKIVNIPCSVQVNGDAAMDVLLQGKHNRGCQCKKTGCIKKYCECFRASIFCADNCKCFKCKNLEGCRKGKPVSCRDQGNAKVCIQQGNAATFSRKFRKRKLKALLDSDMKNPAIQKHTPHEQVNPAAVSSSMAALSLDSVRHFVNSTTLGSSKTEYRSLLADVIHPLDVIDLCNILVVESEAAKSGADKGGRTVMQPTEENHTTDVIAAQDSKNCEKECDEKYNSPWNENLNPGYNVDVYGEQERLVLTCLQDCLRELTTIGTMKARIATGSPLDSLHQLPCQNQN